MLNPMKLLKLKNAWDTFSKAHPKFVKFLEAARKDAIKEDAVIEINVTTKEGKTLSSNIKITNEDTKLFEELSELFREM